MAAACGFRPGFRLAQCLLAGALLCPAASGQSTFYQPHPGAQSTSVQTVPDPRGPYTIRGSVINSVTGAPIRRALVRVGDRMQLTDPQGGFELTGLPAGTFNMDVQKPGFFAQWEDGGVPPLLVNLGPAKADPDIILKLVPEAVITGRITDENGEPVADTPVLVRGWRISGGRRQLQDVKSQSTDEDGHFRVFDLMAGTYYLSIPSMPGPAMRRRSNLREAYPTTYFPGVTQFSAATPIKLTPGATVQADFSLRHRSVFQVAGQITGFAGGRIHTVQIVEGSDASSQPVNFMNDGSFIATVPPGSYSIGVEANDQAGHILFGEAPVNVAGNIAGIVIGLAPGASIPVMVQTEFAGSPAGDNVTLLTVALSPVNLQFPSMFRYQQFSRIEGESGARKLSLQSVQPGRYYVQFTPHGRWYVQSAVSGGADLFREPLTVDPDQAAPIQVVLRDDGATLAGAVQSSGTAARATVLLVTPDEPLRPPLVAVTSTDGTFTLDNVPPADYVLLAFDNISGLEYANPEALRDYLSQGTHVTVGAKEQKTVKLELITR